MDEKRYGAMTGALLLLVGATIGTGVALLFAPQSGEKTRKDVLRYSRKARRGAGELAADVSDRVSGMVDAIEGSTLELIESGRDLAKEKQQALSATVDGGIAKLEE